MGGQPVMVQTSSSATGPWANLKTLTTSAVTGSVGACSVSVKPTGPTYYRFRFVAGAGSGYGSSISFVVRVGVRPVPSAPKAPKSVKARHSFTVRGTLVPHFAAGQKTVQINIYRRKNRRWVLARQVLATNADKGALTSYAVKIKLTSKGRYRFQAYTLSTVTWPGGASQPSKILTVR